MGEVSSIEGSRRRCAREGRLGLREAAVDNPEITLGRPAFGSASAAQDQFGGGAPRSHRAEIADELPRESVEADDGRPFFQPPPALPRRHRDTATLLRTAVVERDVVGQPAEDIARMSSTRLRGEPTVLTTVPGDRRGLRPSTTGDPRRPERKSAATSSPFPEAAI